MVQFALHDKAYLFQLHRAEGHPFLIELLQSEFRCSEQVRNLFVSYSETQLS